MLKHLGAAHARASTLEDPQRLARINAYFNADFRAWGVLNLHSFMGDYVRTLEASERALAMAERIGDFAREIMARYFLGEAYHALGDYRRAIEALTWNVRALDGERARMRFSRLRVAGLPSVFSRCFLVRCLAELGEFDEAIAHSMEAMDTAEAVDQPVDLLGALSTLGFLYLKQGRPGQAVSVLERCLGLVRAEHQPYWFSVIALPLGTAYIHSGSVAAGTHLLEQSVKLAESLQVVGEHSLRIASLGEARLIRGGAVAAAALAARALDLSRTHKERGHEAWSLRLAGAAASQRDPSAIGEGERYYREAVMLAEELKMRPLVGQSRPGYREIAASAQASEHLTTAATIFGDLQMSSWREQAEMERARL